MEPKGDCERLLKACLRGLGLIPGALDHRERRILAEAGIGCGQAAPIEDAAGCGGDRGCMAAGLAEADRIHYSSFSNASQSVTGWEQVKLWQT